MCFKVNPISSNGFAIKGESVALEIKLHTELKFAPGSEPVRRMFRGTGFPQASSVKNVNNGHKIVNAME